MRLALIADTFPPLRTSGAVQLRDLSREFARQGHKLTVMLPAPGLDRPWRLEDFDGAQILRLRAPRAKDVGYARRTLAELIMPYAMLRNLRKSPLAAQKWDGVIWYSPSIFHGPLVSALKRSSHCKSYLIVRDIFPEWAVDMGLMGRGLPYLFFDAIARYQYSIADTIGVQTPGNFSYFKLWQEEPDHSLEVLQNWLDEPVWNACPIRIDDTVLSGKRIFVYAGNMGVAQGLDIFIELAGRMKEKNDVGFVFVGRGSEVNRLRNLAIERSLDNILFFDEVNPDEIIDLYTRCSIGIVSLDHRHKSHNIPGKFLAYMQAGLPVLASVNSGNDLADIIRTGRVGEVCESNSLEDLLRMASRLLSDVAEDSDLSIRCKDLFKQRFSVKKAVQQIVQALHR